MNQITVLDCYGRLAYSTAPMPMSGGEFFGTVTGVQQVVVSSANVATVDWRLGNRAICTLTEDITTLNFIAPDAPTNLIMVIVQGAGPFAITWPGTVTWPGSSAITLSAGAGDRDLVAFYFDGTYYYSIGNNDFGTPP